MAYSFSLSAECGDEQAARALSAYFDGFVVLVADRSVRCVAAAQVDPESNWWAMTCVPGIALASPHGSDPELCKPANMTVVARQLLTHLRGAPPFRYAAIGVEVDHFRYFSEINEDFVLLDFHGLVVCDALWQRLGCPEVFESFSVGYHWRPYRGESPNAWGGAA
jgi:hypothetical protein